MKNLNRLTERDLTRIVRRVVNEDIEPTRRREEQERIKEMESFGLKGLKTGVASCDRNDYKNCLKDYRNIPEYKQLRKKITEYNNLEWWEWYDAMTLKPTPLELERFGDFIQKEVRIHMAMEAHEKFKNTNY